MEAIKAHENGTREESCSSNEGTAKVSSKTITVETRERTELINLSDEIRSFVETTGITDGYVHVMSMHTTAGLYVNEWQDALLHDVKAMAEAMVPKESYYKHNDPEFSD